MALTVATLVNGLIESRSHVLKHMEGMTPEQLDWKPYPECKSARETLAHLGIDDRAALQSLQTGVEPDYAALTVPVDEIDRLKATVAETHSALVAYLLETYSETPLDTEICVWGAKRPLGMAIPSFSSEDHYHAGQIAFIRMATDPAWDYYSAIYGGHEE